MDFIIGIISTIVVWIFVVPIIIIAIKAVKHRKSITKQLLESIYKTGVICSSMIFVFSFIASISYKWEQGINNRLFFLGDILLVLLLKLWPLPIVIYIIKKELRKYDNKESE